MILCTDCLLTWVFCKDTKHSLSEFSLLLQLLCSKSCVYIWALHTHTCSICATLVAVGAVLQEACAVFVPTINGIQIPSNNFIWWAWVCKSSSNKYVMKFLGYFYWQVRGTWCLSSHLYTYLLFAHSLALCKQVKIYELVYNNMVVTLNKWPWSLNKLSWFISLQPVSR